MKKSILPILYTGMLGVLALAGCERRPLDCKPPTALVPVKADWSQSGLSVPQSSGSGDVHRLSLRFFPKNGSAAFDRYLEGNVTEGSVEVPIGKYSVVAYNEAVTDPYWANSVFFTDADDYSKFAANIKTADISAYSFYDPLPGEVLVAEPLRLASWSLDNLEITKDMVQNACGSNGNVTTALTGITMRPLTRQVTVQAAVQNLSSAQFMQGALRGLADKVYMATGTTEQSPATHIFTFSSRQWNPGSTTDGTTAKSYLSFGLMPAASQYMLHIDVLFVTGEVYDPPTPLLYDVSSQVNATPGSDISVKVSVALPYRQGGIDVGGWDDEERPLN